MNRITSFVRGVTMLRVTGASVETFMNCLAARDIHFWSLRQISSIELECCVFTVSMKKIYVLSQRAGFDVKILSQKGLGRILLQLKKRPAFVIGFLLCAVLLAILPMFVWTVQIYGNEQVKTDEIRRSLDDLGVHFGAYGADIDSQMIKVRIMNLIPALRWCAVNVSGGRVTVLVAERDVEPESEQPEETVSNLVADRDGVIVEMEIQQGFRRCKIGDAVKEGDLLVSGIESYLKSTQMVHAYGEVYALTGRQSVCVCPAETVKKHYTGHTETQYSLIVGRKRINLFGNSGIPQASCDKITRRSQLTLPGEQAFPVWLETETFVFYEPVKEMLEKSRAGELLQPFARRYVKDSMIAGQILDETYQLNNKNGLWVITADFSCREMIARTAPALQTESETENGGENH